MFTKHCTYLIIFIISLVIPAYSNDNSSALINEYSVEMLTEEDGFVSSEIYSIIQDHQGMLWFGTAENGVMRYDGQKVTLFEYDSINTNGLSHNDAGNLMLDHDGNIWIGTWGGGANFYNPKQAYLSISTMTLSRATPSHQIEYNHYFMIKKVEFGWVLMIKV